uniref:Uncharacterized protein n=1 Tax=Arion vulgaris TaxID=1028688 RepID=A0A0B7B9M5_9EUPU
MCYDCVACCLLKLPNSFMCVCGPVWVNINFPMNKVFDFLCKISLLLRTGATELIALLQPMPGSAHGMV